MEKLKRGNEAGVYHSDVDLDGRCPECGSKLTEDANYCGVCGEKVVNKSYGEIILEIRREQNGR